MQQVSEKFREALAEHVDEKAWPCCWDGCTAQATSAITFHDQPGHVHDCTPHTAILREWADVATVAPLPCSHPHGNGETWTDTPRDLE